MIGTSDDDKANAVKRPGIRITGSRDAKPPKSNPLKALRRRDKRLEEEVERLDQELRRMQADVKSLMCIYQTLPKDRSLPQREAPPSRSDPLLFSQLFQLVRSLENEMDRMASVYISDDNPRVQEHQHLDSLYQGFVEALLKAYPGLSEASVTLDSLLDDDAIGISALSQRPSMEDGEGYSEEDEGDMLASLRMVQQCLESMLMKVARSERVEGAELDALDHWYQVFASFR